MMCVTDLTSSLSKTRDLLSFMYGDDNGEALYKEDLDSYSLRNRWFVLDDPENELDFELREDGKVYLNDPDLCSCG